MNKIITIGQLIKVLKKYPNDAYWDILEPDEIIIYRVWHRKGWDEREEIGRIIGGPDEIE